jgi:WD40 repeat protein
MLLLGLPDAAAGAGSRPELVVQTGHSNAINAVAMSEDGKRILTGSTDGTAILWDAQTGQKL